MAEAGSDGPQDKGIRSPGRGGVTVVFGFAVFVLGISVLGLAPVISFWMRNELPMNAFLFAISFVALLASMGFALVTISAKAIGLGLRLMGPGGVTREESNPAHTAMSTGVYTHQTFGRRISPSWAYFMVVYMAAVLALPFARFASGDSGSRLVEGAYTAVLFAGVAGAFLYYWIRSRKFGRSVCRMRGKHPRIGGTLEAEVDIECAGLASPLPPLPDAPVSVKLQLRGIKGGLIYETRGMVAPEAIGRPGNGTMRIPIRLPIPAQADEHAGTGYWSLRLDARYAGVDYVSEFAPLTVHKRDEPETRN